MSASQLSIRCKLSRTSVWQAIISSKIGARISSLEITPDEPCGMTESLIFEILPPGITGDLDTGISDEAMTPERTISLERELIAALAKMPSPQHFSWRRDPGPLLSEDLWSALKGLGIPSLRVVDHKTSDGLANFKSVFESPAFLGLNSLSSLELGTRFLDGCDAEDDDKYLASLGEFLDANSQTLENLNLKFMVWGSCVNVSKILSRIKLPRLKEITFFRASSSPGSLNTFLQSHPSIVTLSLSPPMGGRHWDQISLLPGSLPNLMHLNCAPYHAARILEHPSTRPLFCLTGVDVRETIKPSEYFVEEPVAYGSEEEVADELEPDTYLESPPIPAPWRDQFLARLKATTTITHLALHGNQGTPDPAALAEVAPQLRWIDVGTTPDGTTVFNKQWAPAFAAFPELRTLHMGNIGPRLGFALGPRKTIDDKTESAMRRLATSCPKLEAYEDWTETIVVHRHGGGRLSFELEERVKPVDSDGLVFPSQTFVRATLRRLGGPNQPGPGAGEIFYGG